MYGTALLKGGIYSESAIRFLDLQISKTKYRGSSAYAVFETLEKEPCKQKTM